MFILFICDVQWRCTRWLHVTSASHLPHSPQQRKLEQKEENLFKKKKLLYLLNPVLKLILMQNTTYTFMGGLDSCCTNMFLMCTLQYCWDFSRKITLLFKLETHTCLRVVWENLKWYFLLRSALTNCSKSWKVTAQLCM